MVLGKDAEGQLDRSCEKWTVTKSQGGEECHAYKTSRRKSNWIGHILRRICLLKHIVGLKIEGGIEVMGRRRRRRKKLLDDCKKKI